jgi:hypothetical protein
MHRRVVGFWGLLTCGLAASACGDEADGANGVTCVAGTVRNQDNECVATQAGASSAGGEPACSGSDCSSAGNAAQTGGAGQGGGGSEEGGAVGRGGRGTEDGGTANSDAGTGTTGAAGGGAGGDSSTQAATRWLAFEHDDGSFAYDLTKFPSQDGLFQLGDSTLGAWSPNGTKLLHGDQGALFVRDMSGASPGSPILLIDLPQSPSLVRWSADSQSLAMALGATLSVFGTAHPAPQLNTITSTLARYSWCPVGNKLLYLDADGAHVVPVVAGVPGTPQAVTGTTSWSPTGQALAGITASGGLAYRNLASDPPTLTQIFEATVPDTGLEGFFFSPDGSRIGTTGWKDDVERSDALYVNVLPTVGELTTAYTSPPVDVNSASIAWSPDSQWLIYDTDGSLFAVNVTGASPGSPIPLEPGPSSEPTWLPNSVQLITLDSSTNPTSLAILDLLAPEDPLPLLSGVSFLDFQVNPQGTLFGYRTELALHLVDIAAPQQPHVDIPLLESVGSIRSWGWSPDGTFIAAVTDPNADQQRLVRVDGTTVSSPIAIGDTSTSNIRFEWQP